MHPQAEMFRNRLRKNLSRLRPWARRQQVEAYRIYDRDIPEVGLAVDVYGAGVHVAEYARRLPRPEDEQQAWLQDVLESLCAECHIGADDLFLKLREPQRGTAQYQKLGAARAERVVQEGGHRFWVNLSDYLDTGLFLDHRDTRRLVQGLSDGRRVLNLFGYTGSFTVYAGRGGARRTTTVDLSNTYLEWAARNLALNELRAERHQLVRADVLRYLHDAPASASDLYDVIVLDPPTFSNSKKMTGTLDVQRDHPALLRAALRLLAPGGVLVFSSNCRTLQLRPDEVPGARFEDITPKTIPYDFHDPRVHQCWLVRGVA